MVGRYCFADGDTPIAFRSVGEGCVVEAPTCDSTGTTWGDGRSPLNVVTDETGTRSTETNATTKDSIHIESTVAIDRYPKESTVAIDWPDIVSITDAESATETDSNP